jgi:hypothetical protein
MSGPKCVCREFSCGPLSNIRLLAEFAREEIWQRSRCEYSHRDLCIAMIVTCLAIDKQFFRIM